MIYDKRESTDDIVLKFGYGDISVGSNKFIRSMIFQNIRPPHNCGETLREDVELIGDCFNMYFISYDAYLYFNKLLDKAELNPDMRCFKFAGLVFDFTNYNEECIKVCRKHSTLAFSEYFRALAC